MAFSCKRSRTPRPKRHVAAADSDGDRLSALPDDVLHRVLSSVDFLDVVRTSVLSKKWRYVWKSVPYLNFNMERFGEHYESKENPVMEPSYCFWDFVKWALLLRDDSQIIKIFLYGDNTPNDQINALLHFAAKHKIQEFWFHDGDYTAVNEIEFPRGLCESLTVLNLNFRDSIPVRVKAVFVNLRSLYLRGVFITHDAAEKLLSSDCIGLENVHLEDCQVGNIQTINISACNLKFLTIVNICTRVKFWVVCSFESKLRICAPNLLSFYYIGPMLQGFELVNTVSLEHALVRLLRVPKGYEDEFQNYLFCPASFIGFNYAKALTLSTLVVKYFSPASGELLWDDFMLDNLNCLRLELRYHANYIEGFINLLKCSPNLESVCIRFKEIPWSLRKNKKAIESRTPWKSKIEDISCLTSHVKKIRISNFDGSEFGIELVKFLLQNGKVLEKMEINHNSRVRKRRTSNMILALPKASSEVVVSFPENALRKFPLFDKEDSDPEYDD